MYYKILDKKRLNLLPLFGFLKKDFYLAGGTALALQIGHRDSIDFDFFTKIDFIPKELFKKVKTTFQGYKIKKTKEEKNTLYVVLDEDVKVSFLTYKYQLIKPLIDDKELYLASILDIASMKLSAIIDRAKNKDYIDLYFILQRYSLEKILSYTQKKFPTIDIGLVLKSLVYFEDIEFENIKFIDQKIDFLEIKNFLEKQVEQYAK